MFGSTKSCPRCLRCIAPCGLDLAVKRWRRQCPSCFLSAVGSNLKLIYTAKPDTTKQSFQCRVRLRRCELDPRQLKTVAGRKFEVWTRSEQLSHSHRHAWHDADSTVLSCLAGGVNRALNSRLTWNFCIISLPRLLDVAAQLKRSADAALTLAISCAQ